MGIPGEGEVGRIKAVHISPAGGFGDYGKFQLGGQGIKSRLIGDGCQDSFSKKVLLQMVAKFLSERRITAESCVRPGHAAFGSNPGAIKSGDALRGRKCQPCRLPPIAEIFHEVGTHAHLRVPDVKNKPSGLPAAAAGGIPIFVIKISSFSFRGATLDKERTAPVVVAGPNPDNQTINIVIHIKEVGESIMVRPAPDSVISQPQQFLPGGTDAIHLGIVFPYKRRVMDDVPVFCLTAEMGCVVISVGPLVEIVDTPIKAIQVKMHVTPQRAEPPHV